MVAIELTILGLMTIVFLAVVLAVRARSSRIRRRMQDEERIEQLLGGVEGLDDSDGVVPGWRGGSQD